MLSVEELTDSWCVLLFKQQEYELINSFKLSGFSSPLWLETYCNKHKNKSITVVIYPIGEGKRPQSLHIQWLWNCIHKNAQNDSFRGVTDYTDNLSWTHAAITKYLWLEVEKLKLVAQ